MMQNILFILLLQVHDSLHISTWPQHVSQTHTSSIWRSHNIFTKSQVNVNESTLWYLNYKHISKITS